MEGYGEKMFDFLKHGQQGVAQIDRSTPIKEMSYVVLDTELTGLDEKKDSIVSMGAVRMTGGRIDVGDSFYRMVNPERALTKESSEAGIGKALSEFMEYSGGDVLVGHCISIDLEFIQRAMQKTSGMGLQNTALDTLSIYEWTRFRERHISGESGSRADLSLSRIAEGLGIPVRGSHNALMDAFITAQVFQVFISKLSSAGVLSIGELLDLGNPFRGGESFTLSCETGNF